MKSLFILLFFLLIIWITYNYSYKKFYSDKIQKEIKPLLLPLTVDDQFVDVNLKNNYKDMFDNANINKDYSSNLDDEKNADIKTYLENNPSDNKKFQLQRFFTKF
jgi:hypothetical protein